MFLSIVYQCLSFVLPDCSHVTIAYTVVWTAVFCKLPILVIIDH